MNGAQDTIYALASGRGRAGVAVIRISGPRALNTLLGLTGLKSAEPRRAFLRELRDEAKLIDQALVIAFPAPASFTGEDCAEIHCHGGPAIIEAIFAALSKKGLRMAASGEFSRRAFANGKMDLTEAEGLADLIDAETDGQRQQALRQMQGGLRETYEAWRDDLSNILAQIEGEIDFPDEGDVPDNLSRRAGPMLSVVIGKMSTALTAAPARTSIRDGIDIALIGAPNAGKSSLLNRLSGHDAAIVTAKPGTTRDLISVNMVLSGLPVRLIDTAGLRESEDEIEAEGVRRAIAASEDAALRLAVIDADAPQTEILRNLKPDDLVIINKCDLKDGPIVSRETFRVSALTGQNIDALIARLSELLLQRFGQTQSAGLTRLRHQACVQRAVIACLSAEKALDIAPELAGADIRDALRALAELAGETDIDSILDRVFSQFCIGK